MIWDTFLFKYGLFGPLLKEIRLSFLLFLLYFALFITERILRLVNFIIKA